MELRLSQCTIRRFRPGDEEAISTSANDRDIWRNVRDRFPHPYSLGDAAWWIANSGETHLGIEVDGAIAGGIGFDRDEDVFHRSAEIGYWLGKKHWGKGIATAAVSALTDHVFATTDIVRLYAGVFEWNPGSPSLRSGDTRRFARRGSLRSPRRLLAFSRSRVTFSRVGRRAPSSRTGS